LARISPEKLFDLPVKIFMSVVFPAPEAPIIAVISPDLNIPDTPSSILVLSVFSLLLDGLIFYFLFSTEYTIFLNVISMISVVVVIVSASLLISVSDCIFGCFILCNNNIYSFNDLLYLT